MGDPTPTADGGVGEVARNGAMPGQLTVNVSLTDFIGPTLTCRSFASNSPGATSTPPSSATRGLTTR